MRWVRIYMQRSPMCVIDLYVMAANKLYMQWPPMCAMGANISIATNMQWLSLHAMTGRATRVRATVMRYCYTKEVCVHKGKPLSS